MKILYFTNKDTKDCEIIPNIIKKYGDDVVITTKRIDLNFIIFNKINFIVSDRSRFLIKSDVIDFLPKKIINLHSSFLPWNRGDNPIYWSIKERTPHGVTIHYIDESIDTGDIIIQTQFFYSNKDTFRDAYNRSRYFMVSLLA